MKIKWGALIVDGRNKIGGQVASRNRAGAYMRNKVTPINPSTNYQVNIRNRLAGISTDWRALTDAQRLAWNSSVSDFAKTDIFGDLHNPSGFNLHQKLNNNLVNVGESQITVPPLPEAVDAFTLLSFGASVGGQTITITFAPAIDASHKVLLIATPSISPGITFVKAEYRQITVLDSTDVSPYEANIVYSTKYGAIGAENTKIFVQLIQINVTTGQAGIPIQASAIVGA